MRINEETPSRPSVRIVLGVQDGTSRIESSSHQLTVAGTASKPELGIAVWAGQQ
jgi:hypothetical protein